ncbi:MAG: bifunctional demethylmenaquinone methyltransferase/2-methoxy-6-polyprenyl-1,4-benzoquinol methylase UbiE [Sphingomonadales bacterium]
MAGKADIGKQQAAGATASFGYQDVAADTKAGLVRGVFSSVAGRYDLMNDAMSLGLHRLWKNDMAAAIDPRAGERLLDVAGGTGDIAMRLAARLAKRGGAAAGGRIHVLDINQDMLAVGRARADKRGLAAMLDWTCGDAEALPFADRAFDAYSIAFGIRNVTNIAGALAQAHRVLDYGGRFFCLEFSTFSLPLLDRLYDRYSFDVIPRLGARLAGDADSYRYLVESIRRFPDADAFAQMMRDAGFAQVRWRPFAGGAVALHQGWRL